MNSPKTIVRKKLYKKFFDFKIIYEFKYPIKKKSQIILDTPLTEILKFCRLLVRFL